MSVPLTELAEAIEEYNEYHSPMATAQLLDARENEFAVQFEGPFCRMCCDYDYFEDLILELQDIDAERLEIADIDYVGNEKFRVVYVTQS